MNRKNVSSRKRDAWLFAATMLLIVAAFIMDWRLPLGVAGGVLFIVPVALTLLFLHPVYTWTVAGVSAILIVLDIFLKPASEVPIRFVLINRGYAFLAVGIVVGIGYLQWRLVRQNERLATLSMMEERERLSRELHDDLSQLLGSIGARATAVSELLAQKRTDEAQNEMAQLRQNISEAYRDVRQYITGLRVRPWGDRRFLDALADFARSLAGQADLKLSFDMSERAENLRLAPQVEIQAIRIAQEALSNSLRHADARNLWLKADLNDTSLQIIIQDDGQGFEPASVDRRSHLGLQMMRERAEMVGGTVNVVSTPGKGTSVTVTLPRETGKKDAD